MKVYNVKDTEKFFEVLNDCQGDVEIVGKDGSMIPFNGSDNARILEDTYADIDIHEMELKFSDPKDAVNMIIFLGNLRRAA